MEVSSQELFEAIEIIRSRRANAKVEAEVEEEEDFIDGFICTECGCVHADYDEFEEDQEDEFEEDQEDEMDNAIEEFAQRTGLNMISVKDNGESPIDLIRQHPHANQIFENYLASNGIPYSIGVQLLNKMQGREREVFLQLLTLDPTK